MFNKPLSFFLKKGILTGSRAFHVNTKDSDYDIAVTTKQFQKVLSKLESKYIIDGKGSGSDWNKLRNRYNITFLIDNDIRINLISYDTKKALKIIKKINYKILDKSSTSDLYHRETRYAIFEHYISKYMNDEVLGIPEININDDEVPFY